MPQAQNRGDDSDQVLEDVYLATQRLQHPAKNYSAEAVKHELGL